MNKKSVLGKGLSALINSTNSSNNLQENQIQGFIPNLPVNLLIPNRYQPRIDIDPLSLVSIADSIRQHGVIEPLIVSKINDGKYELIAGERRWRAAQIANLETIPVIIKDISPQNMLELAIIENVQREDLNPFEEALAFEQLHKSFNLTHSQIAEKVSLSRPTVVNKIRLLKLPDEVKRGLLENKISEGHAKALLGLINFDTISPTYDIVLRDSLSVRAVEELVRRLNNGAVKQKKPITRLIDETTLSMEHFLQEKFGKNTFLEKSQKGGKIIIKFSSEDEFKKIYKLLSK